MHLSIPMAQRNPASEIFVIIITIIMVVPIAPEVIPVLASGN